MFKKSFNKEFFNFLNWNFKDRVLNSKDRWLRNNDVISLQTRNTHILKRRNPPPTLKFEKDVRDFKPRRRNEIYDLVEDTFYKKKDPIKVILVKPVEGLGLPGDVVEVRPNKCREKLLLPGLAAYASPENLEKYRHLSLDRSYDVPSSKFVPKTCKKLESMVISVLMNMEEPWQVAPWHVRVALRRRGITVPEEAISIPESPIKGPDLTIEGKEFAVKITVNNKEEVWVRFRVHHVATEPMNRLPWKRNFWTYRAPPALPDDPDQVRILEELNAKDDRLVEEIHYEH